MNTELHLESTLDEQSLLSDALVNFQCYTTLLTTTNEALIAFTKDKTYINSLTTELTASILSVHEHDVMFVNSVKDYSLDISKIMCTVETENKSCTGWVERVNEVIAIHKTLKEIIVNIFSNFNEIKYATLFSFLKIRLGIHEKYMWSLREYLNK